MKPCHEKIIPVGSLAIDRDTERVVLVIAKDPFWATLDGTVERWDFEVMADMIYYADLEDLDVIQELHKEKD